MKVTDKGIDTQLKNIQVSTGKTLDELRQIIQDSGLVKHSEVRAMLQHDLGLSFVHADTLILCLRQLDEDRVAAANGTAAHDVLKEIYTGPKANLRPIHDKLMAELEQFGPFEVAPKKGYVSLRR